MIYIFYIILCVAIITFIVSSGIYIREVWMEYKDHLRDEGARWMYRRMMNEIRMRNERQSALDILNQIPEEKKE